MILVPCSSRQLVRSWLLECSGIDTLRRTTQLPLGLTSTSRRATPSVRKSISSFAWLRFLSSSTPRCIESRNWILLLSVSVDFADPLHASCPSYLNEQLILLLCPHHLQIRRKSNQCQIPIDLNTVRRMHRLNKGWAGAPTVSAVRSESTLWKLSRTVVRIGISSRKVSL